MSNPNITRREFVVTGSLVIAGLALPDFARAARPADRLAVSVGFLGETRQTFEGAEKILTGDPVLFSQGARLSFGEMKRAGGDPLSVSVDVIYRTYEGDDVPFFAFTHAEAGGRVMNSTPSSFVVPVPAQGTVDLSITARRSASEAATVVSFAVNTAGHALKFNPGTYVLALTDRAVAWSSFSLDEAAGFDYVVMTVRADSASK